MATGVVSETVFRERDPRYRGIVTGEYQGWSEQSNEVVRRREVPACLIPFIINLGSALYRKSWQHALLVELGGFK